MWQRRRSEEWMDAPEVAPSDLRASLAFIERVNRWLGYARTTIQYLESFSRGWPTGAPIRLLDVASGSADIPRAILAWCDRARPDIRLSITAADLHPVTLEIARSRSSDTRITFVRADAMRLPFLGGAYD